VGGRVQPHGLVNGHADALTAMVSSGDASRLSRGLTYTLFENVVNYTKKYRGMHSVVIHDFEAYADVILSSDRHGTWHTPPHWIDSLFHIGGFIMNGSEASNTKDYFYVTNGCSSCRMLKPAVPGGSYGSYVRMAPDTEPNMHVGDVYIMQDGEVVGMMGGMRFRRVHRILMDKFFSPPDAPAGDAKSTAVVHATPAKAKVVVNTKPKTAQRAPAKAKAVVQVAKPVVDRVVEIKIEDKKEAAPAKVDSNAAGGVVGDALKLVAKETGLDLSDLTDEATFVELGVDSLTSLVLAETFKKQLEIEVNSSLFLECVTVNDLKVWLEQNA
jgi:acyl carrier protein